MSDHAIKEAHSVFKSVNALYLSREREEINDIKYFLLLLCLNSQCSNAF